MWETHWREEWAVLTGTTLSFYQTNRRKPSIRIALLDIKSVDHLPTAEQPFVGYHFLAIECIGRVHYMCTATHGQQQRWLLALGQQIRLASNRQKQQQEKQQLRRSKRGRLKGSIAGGRPQVGGGISIAEIMAEQHDGGIAMDFDLDSLLDSGASKFIARFEARQWLPRGRLVLNSKRMCFQTTHSNMQVLIDEMEASRSSRKGKHGRQRSCDDIEDPTSFTSARDTSSMHGSTSPTSMRQRHPCAVAALLLRRALRLSPDSHLTELSDFFDLVSSLKNIGRRALSELSHEQTIAFFLNIYHTLIAHACLLLSPPTSSLQWSTFFNQVSYVCAGEIFSCAEIEHCILRPSFMMGKLYKHQKDTLRR
jgi:hypothetical protein